MSVSRGLRRAKRMLHKRCAAFEWFAGVGIVPAQGGPGLRVTATRQPGPGEVPTTYFGFPVELVVIRSIEPRRGTR